MILLVIDFAHGTDSYFAPEGWAHLFQGIDNNAFHNSAMREATFELEGLPAHYDEVIRRVADWVNTPKVTEHALWLHGPSNKPSIAQAVAADLQKREHVLFVTYFVGEDPENKDVRIRFIPTIAYQLGLLFPSVYEKLGITIAHDPSLLSLAVSSQLDSLLLRPLSDTLDDPADVQHQPVVILVDGCDLLNGSTQASVINALLKLPQQFSHRVRLLLFTKSSALISTTLASSLESGLVAEVVFGGDRSRYSFPPNLEAIVQRIWNTVKGFAWKTSCI